MPSTLGGLVLFTALMIPGFVFLERRETRLPGREYSSLREVATVLIASLWINAVVLLAFGVARAFLPKATPDVGAIVRTPRTYLHEHFVSVTAWSFALLAVASSLAALLATPPVAVVDRLEALGGKRTADFATGWRGSPNPIREISGWAAAFLRYDDCRVDLAVYLKDGSYVAGGLMDFNPQISENDDRSLQLAGPVQYRAAGQGQPIERAVGGVLIPGREIQMIEITYIPV